MRFLETLPAAAVITVVTLGLLAAPGPAMAQTPPPTPTVDDTANDDDLPEPVSRRTGRDGTDGPPDLRRDKTGPPPLEKKKTPPPVPTLAYYVAIDGQQQGPLDEAALIALIKAGTLKATTRVWTEGMADWDTAGNVAEMAALIKAHAPPPVVPAVSFFVVEGGRQAGPFTLDQIKAKIAAGTFTAESMVWKKGMSAWVRAGDVAELSGLLKKTPPKKKPDARNFLTGRWELGPLNVPVEGVGPATIRSVIEYAADGTYKFQGFKDYTFGQVPYREISEGNGTYTATFKDDNTITVTVKGQATITLMNRSNSEVSNSKFNQVNRSFNFKIIDRNSVSDGGAQPWRRVGS